MESVRECKRAAAELVGRRGNRIRLILCGILLIFAVAVPWIVAHHLTVMIFGEIPDVREGRWLEYGISLIIGTLLTMLVTVPCVGGWYAYAADLVSRTETGAPLYGKAQPVRYGQLYVCGVMTALRPVLAVLLFLAADALYSGDKPFWQLLLYLAAALLTACLFLCTRRQFLLSARLAQGDDLIDAIGDSRRLTRRHPRLFGDYWKHFFWQLPLGLLTVGVSLFLYTLPMMITTYFILANQAADGESKEEESNA